MSLIESLETTILNLWMPNSTRSRYNDFKPVFQLYAGLPSSQSQEYDNICKQIDTNQKEHPNQTVIIPSTCVFETNPVMLKAIQRELQTADLNHLSAEQIVMYNDPQMNARFLDALHTVLQLRKQAGSISRKQEENFILTLLVLFNKYARSVEFESSLFGKIIYYCEHHDRMPERDLWFLMLAHCMAFDVLVLSPAGIPLPQHPVWNHAERIQESSYCAPVSFQQRVSKGTGIQKIMTSTAVAASQIEQTLFNFDTRVFKDWQLRNAQTQSLVISGTRQDLDALWDRESRSRDGFFVNEQNTQVHLPVFLWEFDGVTEDPEDFARLVFQYQEVKHPELLLFTDSTDELKGTFQKEHTGELIACMNPNGTFQDEKLKHARNNALSSVSSETAKRIVQTLNQLIQQKGLTSRNEIIPLADSILNMPPKILRMMENFDYPKDVPKIILFLENETRISRLDGLILDFLHMSGFDLLLFVPSGVSGYDNRNLTKERLSRMVYNQKVPVFSRSPQKSESTDLFSRFLNRKKK